MRAFWVTSEAVVPYEKHLLSSVYEDEEIRFLFWEGEKRGGRQDDLLLVGAGKRFIHEKIAETFWEKTDEKIPISNPDGAGYIDGKNYSVRDWMSYGLKIRTPKKLRPKIMAALDF